MPSKSSLMQVQHEFRVNTFTGIPREFEDSRALWDAVEVNRHELLLKLFFHQHNPSNESSKAKGAED